MEGKVYGYIRVSTREQNIERQVISLLEAGVNEKNIYIDKQSGKNFQRPAYKKMMSRVREGDLIIIKSIDRLGRNYQEIMEQWRIITKEKSRYPHSGHAIIGYNADKGSVGNIYQ